MPNAKLRIRHPLTADKIFDICRNKVYVYCVLGENASAVTWAMKGLSISDLVGSQKQFGEACLLLSFVHSYTGEFEKIENYAQKALELFAVLKDPLKQAEAISGIGYVFETRGQHQQAMDCYRRALIMEKQCGDVAAQAISMRNIGSLYNTMGNVREAIRCVRQSLLMTNGLDEDPRELGIAHNNLGLYYSRLSDTERTLACYEKGWKIFNDIGYSHGIAILGCNIAQEYFYQGKNTEARELFANSLYLARRIGEKEVEAGVLISQLTVMVDQEKMNDEVVEILKRTEILAHEVQYQELQRKYYIAAGHANCLMGRTELGQDLCRKAEQITERMDSAKGRVDVKLLKACCLAADGKHVDAQQYFHEAAEGYEKINYAFESGRTLFYLARSEIASQDWQEATAHCQAAIAWFEKLGYMWFVDRLRALSATIPIVS